MKNNYTGLDAVIVPFNNTNTITSTVSIPCKKIYVTHFDQDPIDNLCDQPTLYEQEPESGATWTESWSDDPPD